MGIKELRLVPVAAEAVPHNIADLAVSLRQIGFLGDALGGSDPHQYHPGHEFHSCIEFASSHPIVMLEDQRGRLVPGEVIDSREACTIAFSTVSETPEFGGGPETIDPRCPTCGYIVTDWTDVLTNWWEDKTNHRWSCPNCGARQRVYDLDWQHAAALLRFQISIGSIRFGEARPTPKLMNALASATGFQWTHYYY